MFEHGGRWQSYLLAIFGCALWQVACGPDCLTADNVAILDDNGKVFLVYRVTGIQDKMGFFELYGAKPSFDQCGKASLRRIDVQPYDPAEGLLKAVELRGGHLMLVYTHNRTEAIEPQHARLVVK